LSGKNVIVTGGNTGIGKETARVLVLHNASVYLACRDESKGNAAVEEIKKLTSKNDVQFLQLDLSSLESVRETAKTFNEKNIPLHILINNAGVMACPKMKTKDGFELQIGVNHFGHFLLTNLLIESMKRAPSARVVCVSSRAHNRGKIDLEDPNYEKREYTKWGAYGQSKLANVLFARELNKRMSGENIKAFSLHPGVIPTELTRHMNSAVRSLFKSVGSLFIKTIPQGAATSVYVATAPEVENSGGAYFADCNVTQSPNSEVNDEMALKLWELSVKTVGLGAEETVKEKSGDQEIDSDKE